MLHNYIIETTQLNIFNLNIMSAGGILHLHYDHTTECIKGLQLGNIR